MKIGWSQPRSKDKKGEITEHFFRELDIQFLIHELKDPMGIIVTVLRSLLEKREKYGPLLPRQEKALKRASQAVLQIQGMLNDLLEIGRSETRQFVYNTFQPKRVVYACLLDTLEIMEGTIFEQIQEHNSEEEALSFLNHAGIYLEVAPDVEELKIIQDETKFRQIVGNLIKNALRFRSKRLEVRLRREGELLYVEVEDDGPGIKPEAHDIIFRRYTQIKRETSLERKGHGLGLASALIQARYLGGDITVESEAGEGAMFCLTIPVKMEKKKS